MNKIRIIKKYPNRRLYDTSIGEYITLEEIRQLVLDKEEFQVIDARTKKDLTQGTLLQIIAEQENSSTPIFNTKILQDFIRFYPEKSQNVFTEYLEQAMQLFIHQKDFVRHQWQAYQDLLAKPVKKKRRQKRK